jgi:hypothetical protein
MKLQAELDAFTKQRQMIEEQRKKAAADLETELAEMARTRKEAMARARMERDYEDEQQAATAAAAMVDDDGEEEEQEGHPMEPMAPYYNVDPGGGFSSSGEQPRSPIGPAPSSPTNDPDDDENNDGNGNADDDAADDDDDDDEPFEVVFPGVDEARAAEMMGHGNREKKGATMEKEDEEAKKKAEVNQEKSSALHVPIFFQISLSSSVFFSSSRLYASTAFVIPFIHPSTKLNQPITARSSIGWSVTMQRGCFCGSVIASLGFTPQDTTALWRNCWKRDLPREGKR